MASFVNIKNFLLRSYFIKIYLFFAVLGGAYIFIFFSKGEFIKAINTYANSNFDIVFKIITELGNGWILTALAVVMLIYKYHTGIICILSLLLTTAVASFLKFVIFPEKMRPRFSFDDSFFVHLIDNFDYHSNFSFPSGHTMTAFCFFTCLAFTFRNKVWESIFITLAVLVGLSRIYLLQHFFIDVFFGSIFGILNSIISILLINKIFKNKQFISKGIKDLLYKNTSKT
ncbi:MAG: phosphatase PAP2 family protein [Bacteroidales bacterium]|nr:phosphatase PAP2 family protein [Bacteroidales bacterium]